MARPQLEDGHTQIANEILESLMRVYLPPNQWQVLLCIIRKTYGFKKKVDWIANCQIVEATGLVKSTVSRALKSLEQQQLIKRNGKTIGFQKDWEQWKVSNTANNQELAEQSTLGTKLAGQLTDEKLADRKQKLAIQSTGLAIQSTKVSNPFVTQKKKETITKETIQKKERPLKQKFGEFLNVFLTAEEYGKLVKKFEQAGAEARIEELSVAIESKGYRYHSHYATILNWAQRDQKGGIGGTHKGHSRELKPRTTYKSPEDHRRAGG